MKIHKIGHGLLVGFNVFLTIVLLLLLMSYYFELFNYIAVLSLFTPILVGLHFGFVLYWLAKRKRMALLSFTALIISYLVFGSFYRFNSQDNDLKNEDELKVLTFNVWGFNKNEWIKKPGIGDKIIEFIRDEDPDILCLQEHSRIRHRQLRQYPFRTETPITGRPRATQVIFSKFPIVGNGSLELPNTVNNIIFADILVQKDTIRVYNVHLQSYKIVPNSNIITQEKQTKETFKRIAETFDMQYDQAVKLDQHRKKCKYPTLIMGDFNNTQFSNVYRTIRANMKDSFLKQGKGIGRTYELFDLPMRIDYIFADDNFKITGHKNYDVEYSDHYPIMASLRLEAYK